MNYLFRVASKVLPYRLAHRLEHWHRSRVFNRAMKRFLESPRAATKPGNDLIKRLIYGWGNEDWSALDEYLTACISHALEAKGAILECGSGLSTVLIGAVAQATRQPHWAFEHNPEWAAKVDRCLREYRVNSTTLRVRPLKDYGDFSWYDAASDAVPAQFTLVICDGPPGTTKGGRYGLVPVMGDRLVGGCVILLDDADRDEERAIAKRWQAERGAEIHLGGHAKPYIRCVNTHVNRV